METKFLKFERKKLKINLESKDKKAIDMLKNSILKEFPDAHFILFGSKVRGNSDEFSDIDILVLINNPINTAIEEKIYDISYEISLEYDTVFNLIIEYSDFLDSKLAQEMPLYKNIAKEGIAIWAKRS